jgi:hypothetical protein
LIFFRSLDRQLNAHPQEDRIAIDAWLQSEQSKADYGHYFFHTKEIKDLPFAQDDPSGRELKTLYESCTARLKELGLGHYCDETLPPELVAKRKSQFTEHKDHHQKMIEDAFLFSGLFPKCSGKILQLQNLPNGKQWRRGLATSKRTEIMNTPFFSCPCFLPSVLS